MKKVFIVILIIVNLISCFSLLNRPNNSNNSVVEPLEEPKITIASPVDDSIPEWRIGYRIYWHYENLQIPKHYWKSIIEELQLFADDVYVFSGNGLRVSIDVFDMDVRDFPGEVPSDDLFEIEFPKDTSTFQRLGKYNSVFFSFPWLGPIYQGVAHPLSDYSAATFPMGLDKEGEWVIPWELLFLHEFLHLVVGHYSEIEWPEDDVHGAEVNGYVSDYPMVDPDYFSDMMQGKVIAGRKKTGILPEQYGDFGLPFENQY